ncbi:MAG: hypothetical protein HOV87_11860 [Catenulispora sp.]|nr:hypothetical protein [Catenulispora sp.]NUT43926.1 hypothetical protein [Thermoactinospora sp.]
MNTATDTLTSATAHRPHWEHDVTDEFRTETIDGIECTDRAGIAALTGLALNSLNMKALKDDAFPQPIRGQRIGRTFWYPVDAVRAYAQHLAELADAGKPKPVADGDPDELLDPPAAADAIGINYETFRRYVALSRPYWDGIVEGRPLLPRPDVVTIAERGNLGQLGEHREWRRATLAEHQASRPGSRATAADGRTGRPANS